MLQNQYNFTANQVTVTQVVANLGAMLGGTVVGYCSQIFGRRFSIMVMCVIGGALLYPYTFTSGTAVAGRFEILYWWSHLHTTFVHFNNSSSYATCNAPSG